MHISSPLLSETVHPVGPPNRVDGHVLEHGEECCLQSWLRHCLLISELIYKCLMDHSVLWGRPVPGKKPEREPLCSSFHKTSAPGQGRIGPVYGDHLDKGVSFAYSFVTHLLVQSVLVEPLTHLAVCSARTPSPISPGSGLFSPGQCRPVDVLCSTYVRLWACCMFLVSRAS